MNKLLFSTIEGRCQHQGLTDDQKARGLLIGCLTWQFSLQSSGYGQMKIEGRDWLTHRAAFACTQGAIPAGMLVLHKCDNRACCEPSHLYLGDAKQNIADMDARGRRVVGDHTGPRVNKLTEANVRTILTSAATATSLAKDLGVSPANVMNIRVGRRKALVLPDLPRRAARPGAYVTRRGLRLRPGWTMGRHGPVYSPPEPDRRAGNV